MNDRRIIATIAAAGLILVSCGGDQSSVEDTAPTATNQQTGESESSDPMVSEPDTTVAEPADVTTTTAAGTEETGPERTDPVAGEPDSVGFTVTEDVDITSSRTMDVYAPEGGDDWPVVVLWSGQPRSLDPSNGHRIELESLATAVVEHGAVVFNVSYGAITPAQAVNDTACSLQLASEQAAHYGGDPDRVVVVGNSFGGAVALIWGLGSPLQAESFTDCTAQAGSLETLPDAVVAVASGMDPRNIAARAGNEAWLEFDDAYLDAVTPMLLVGGNPDVKVFLGPQWAMASGLASPEASEALHEALLTAGYESVLRELPGGHGSATVQSNPQFHGLVELVIDAIAATGS